MTTDTTIDTSTLQMHRVEKLPIYKVPPTYKVSEHMESACFGDPPGFPTHYIQHVYTRYGNSPRGWSGQLLLGRKLPDFFGHNSGVDHFERRRQWFMRLWNAPPLDDPRIEAWVRETYTYHAHCYLDVNATIKPFERDRPARLIFPVPWYDLPPKPRPSTGEHADRTLYLAALSAWRDACAEVQQQYAVVCTPERHEAHMIIRAFYPHAPIRHDLIEESNR